MKFVCLLLFFNTVGNIKHKFLIIYRVMPVNVRDTECTLPTSGQ